MALLVIGVILILVSLCGLAIDSSRNELLVAFSCASIGLAGLRCIQLSLS